jgi:transcriptional regulator with XRE-family HTH domain
VNSLAVYFSYDWLLFLFVHARLILVSQKSYKSIPGVVNSQQSLKEKPGGTRESAMGEGQERERTPNQRLQEQRVLRGWSHREVALRIEERFPGVAVTANDVRRWENGKRRPGPYYRVKLCAVFGATEEQLGFRTPCRVVCKDQEERSKQGEKASSWKAERKNAGQAGTKRMRKNKFEALLLHKNAGKRHLPPNPAFLAG